MATYQDIRGLRVKYLSADPSNTATGEVWYNSTTGTLRSHVISDAWASSAPLSGAIRNGMGSTGIQTAALSVGGQPPGSYANFVEEYNGAGWTTGTVYPLSIQGPFVAGTVTAAVVTGGHTYPPATDRTETFEYDGTTWSPTGALPAGRRGLNCSGFGSQTAAVQSGGLIPGGVQNTSNEYNGSTWTAGNTINTYRYVQGGAGILTAGVIAGGAGVAPAYADLSATEEYDGTNWTSVTSMTTARSAVGSSNQAPQTSTIIFGGGNPNFNATEAYDGTSWTTRGTLATARNGLGGAGGSGSSGLAFAGYSTADTSITEEYNFSTNLITPGTWSSGGALSTGRSGVASAGTLAAGLAVGGENPGGRSNSTEEYDGSAWTTGGNYTAPMAQQGATGTQTAAISSGGHDGGYVSAAAIYNGTSWTASPSINTAMNQPSMGGSTTAAFGICGGENPVPTAGQDHETWNGSTWTSATNIPTVRVQGTALGRVPTDILACGGRANTPGAPSVRISSTDGWNGSSWTAGTSMLEVRSGAVGMGTTSDGFVQNGNGNPGLATLLSQNKYDGTSWSSGPNNATSHGGPWGTGTTSGGASPLSTFMAGTPGGGTATEEFNVETSAANIETLTTS